MQLYQDQQVHLRQLKERESVGTGVEQDNASTADGRRDRDAEGTEDTSPTSDKENEPTKAASMHHKPFSPKTTLEEDNISIEGSHGRQMDHGESADDEDVIIFKGDTCSRGVRDRSEVT